MPSPDHAGGGDGRRRARDLQLGQDIAHSRLRETAPRTRASVADTADQSYLSATSEIRMTEAFASQPWRVLLSESKDEVLEPMVEFTNTFLMVVGLSSLIVLLLSVSQIRRSVLPLEELQKGTRRIAQRDFASRVTVTSRDEFEQLAASFNTMATQLGRQFNALATAAEIDRAVLSATDATAIVDTILARIRDVFPCSVVSVTVGVPDSSKSLTSVIQDYADRPAARGPGRHASGRTSRSILTGPEVLELRNGESVPAYLEPLVELGRDVLRGAAALLPAPAVRHHCAGRALRSRRPPRKTGCRCAGWPTRPRWRWPTRECWIRSASWPTTTA